MIMAGRPPVNNPKTLDIFFAKANETVKCELCDVSVVRSKLLTHKSSGDCVFSSDTTEVQYLGVSSTSAVKKSAAEPTLKKAKKATAKRGTKFANLRKPSTTGTRENCENISAQTLAPPAPPYLSHETIEKIKSEYQFKHFVYLWKVGLNRIDRGKIFDDNFGRIVDDVSELDVGCKYLLVRLLCRKHTWLRVDQIKYEYFENVHPWLQRLASMGLLEIATPNNMTIKEAVQALTLEQCQNVAKSFKLGAKSCRNSLNKVQILSGLLDCAKQQTILGTSDKLNRDILLQFMEASQMDQRVASLVLKKQPESVLSLAQIALNKLVVANTKGQFIEHLRERPQHLWRFSSPIFVWIRIIYQGVEAQQKLNDYADACDWITQMLKIDLQIDGVHLISRKYRGLWYERLALNAHKHLKRIDMALQAILDGLKSEHVPEHNKLALSERFSMIDRQMAKTKKQDPNLLDMAGEIRKYLLSVEAANEVSITGATLDSDRAALSGRKNVFLTHNPSPGNSPRKSPCGNERQNNKPNATSKQKTPVKRSPRGKRSVVVNSPIKNKVSKSLFPGVDSAVDETGDKAMSSEGKLQTCSVENVALNHCLKNGGFTHGVHAESSIWHSILGLLFWYQIYPAARYEVDWDYAKWTLWLCPTQSEPLDLYRSFSKSEEFERQKRWLISASPSEITQQLTEIFHAHQNRSSLVKWGLISPNFTALCHLVTRCVGGVRLAEMADYMFADWRSRRSGFPDLLLWKVDERGHEGKCMAVEVKGPNDRLSTKQKIWLQKLAQLQIDCQVVRVVAQ